ncbi:MAG: glyoxalase [Lachnospiraceae bacterium]|nr:glyoxalase [Lachnospiraceae bacterium]
MQEITTDIAEFFLKEQGKLFDEPVADNIDEAIEFLEDNMAVVLENVKELKKYWEEEGIDIEEMTDEEIMESLEVFELPDGRILLVEA